MNTRKLRAELISLFKENMIESPETASGLIIMHALGIGKTELILGERAVGAEEELRIREYAARLTRGEPIQYIVGRCEFMSLEFDVSPAVLIPRADTETLVEAVMDRLDKTAGQSVIDIGCGSGIIGISLAYYMKNIAVLAIDISDGALATAKSNADKCGIADRVEFQKLDIMEEFPQQTADCVVSNPPYIKTEVIGGLEPRVRDFEPLTALDGGEDGLDFYRRIAKAPMLKVGGLLAFEIGFDQGREVADILSEYGYKNIEVLPDIEGRDRVVLGNKR